MKIKVTKTKNKNLSKSEKDIINSTRIKEWGEKEAKNLDNDYEPDTEWFFIQLPPVKDRWNDN